MTPVFRDRSAKVGDVEIAYSIGGSGPPVLMLHGFPQTRALWSKVAPNLAERFTVVCADLRGYGASSKPKGAENYSFRLMGADQVALMKQLGFDHFHLVGHDRGARTAHRMALDAPERVDSLCVMDIVPTQHLLSTLTPAVAKAYYHWFFLAQPEPFPEQMILANADRYYESCLLGWGAANLEKFAPEQLAAYRAAWNDPECVRGMCDDYRATLTHDLALDVADLKRKVTCPALVLYGAQGAMAQAYDIAETWSERLSTFTAHGLSGGHFFVDEFPHETSETLLRFLSSLKP